MLSSQAIPSPQTSRRSGQIITVGLGGMGYSSRLGDVLIGHVSGLSVGVTLFDPDAWAGGMLHCHRLRPGGVSPADVTGLGALVEILKGRGACAGNLHAKITANFVSPAPQTHTEPVAAQIYEAVILALEELGVTIVAEHMTEARSRTMLLHLDRGRTEIRINSLGQRAIML